MMMRLTKWLSSTLAITLFASTAVAAQAPMQAAASHYVLTPRHALKYASERSAHKFAGATRIVLDQFNPTDKDVTSASLQLDNNEVLFSVLGEPRVTVAFYKSFEVKLTRQDGADLDGRDRCVFLVELPEEFAAALGGHSLRLVAPVGDVSQPRGVRLVLTNRDGRVTAAMELWPVGTSSETVRSPVSHEPATLIQRRSP